MWENGIAKNPKDRLKNTRTMILKNKISTFCNVTKVEDRVCVYLWDMEIGGELWSMGEVVMRSGYKS